MEVLSRAVLGGKNSVCNEIRDQRSYDHHHTHDEDPGDELRANDRRTQGQRQERDQGHSGYTIGLETVCGRSYRVPRVVPGAIGNYTWILWVILRQLKDDLHQVRPDIRNFCEDAATNAQR